MKNLSRKNKNESCSPGIWINLTADNWENMICGKEETGGVRDRLQHWPEFSLSLGSGYECQKCVENNFWGYKNHDNQPVGEKLILAQCLYNMKFIRKSGLDIEQLLGL